VEAAAHDQTATTERADKATEELRRMAAGAYTRHVFLLNISKFCGIYWVVSVCQ